MCSNKKRYKVGLSDVPGSYYNYKRTEHYPSQEAILIVFDITNNDSLVSVLEDWIEYILLQIKFVPIILVGNKCDCIDEREISSDRVRIICDEIGIQYIEVSAKENINIDYLFHELIENAKQLSIIQAIKTVRLM